MDKNPIQQFRRWFALARRKRSILLPEAMCLATVNTKGRPEARMVLLKSFGEAGFVFYTNLKSPKARSLHAKPYATLTFFWEELGRQVRIEGSVKKVSTREADTYFHTRPFQSQVAAWASDQSQPLKNRQQLQNKFHTLLKKWRGQEVLRPPFWSGFRVVPNKIEFWEGRPYRLHDRILFTRSGKKWKMSRLSP